MTSLIGIILIEISLAKCQLKHVIEDKFPRVKQSMLNWTCWLPREYLHSHCTTEINTGFVRIVPLDKLVYLNGTCNLNNVIPVIRPEKSYRHCNHTAATCTYVSSSE